MDSSGGPRVTMEQTLLLRVLGSPVDVVLVSPLRLPLDTSSSFFSADPGEYRRWGRSRFPYDPRRSVKRVYGVCTLSVDGDPVTEPPPVGHDPVGPIRDVTPHLSCPNPHPILFRWFPGTLRFSVLPLSRSQKGHPGTGEWQTSSVYKSASLGYVGVFHSSLYSCGWC